MVSSTSQLVPQLTNEAKLLTRLLESCKEDLAKLEISKKERIRRLAIEIDNHGIIPTEMICNFISSKLDKRYRGIIIDALDSKYKNQTIVASHKHKEPQLQLQESLSPYAPKPTDFVNFNVRDCVIESWEIYPDEIKKRWVIQLMDDKRTLQCQLIELQRAV